MLKVIQINFGGKTESMAAALHHGGKEGCDWKGDRCM
jgi:hypothetical protein